MTMSGIMARARMNRPENTGTYQAFLSQIGGSYKKLRLRDAITNHAGSTY